MKGSAELNGLRNTGSANKVHTSVRITKASKPAWGERKGRTRAGVWCLKG